MIGNQINDGGSKCPREKENYLVLSNLVCIPVVCTDEEEEEEENIKIGPCELCFCGRKKQRIAI